MGTYDASQVGFFLLDGYSLLPYIEKVTDGGCELQTDTILPLGAATPYEMSLGRVKGSLGMSGFLDDTALASHPALSTRRGASRIAALAPIGNTIGAVFTGANVVQTKYDPIADTDRIHRYECGLACGEFDRGIIIANLAARTTAGDTKSTYTDETGALSSNGAAAYLEVSALALGGYTNCIVKVAHSTDHTTWADLITFDAVTLAQTAQRKLAVGTVNRYMAVTWTWTGAGAGQSITFAVGAARL